MTSYRAELAGILEALILTHTLIKSHPENLHDLGGFIYYDNKAAVLKYEQLEGYKPQSIRQATENDSDLLQELRAWKQKVL